MRAIDKVCDRDLRKSGEKSKTRLDALPLYDVA